MLINRSCRFYLKRFNLQSNEIRPLQVASIPSDSRLKCKTHHRPEGMGFCDGQKVDERSIMPAPGFGRTVAGEIFFSGTWAGVSGTPPGSNVL